MFCLSLGTQLATEQHVAACFLPQVSGSNHNTKPQLYHSHHTEYLFLLFAALFLFLSPNNTIIMVLPSSEQSTTRQNDFLDFFSQAIERYKKSVKECSAGEEEEAAKPSPRKVPPKKRSPVHMVSDDSSRENPSKLQKTCPSSEGGTVVDEEENPGDTPEELEKKRLASRVSSRRTREREKLRMDHFRNAKLKLQQENSKLKDENDEIRGLIQKIKEEKEFLEHKKAAVQSMLAQNPPAAPAQLPLPLPQQHQPSMAPPPPQNMAALLLNALVQAQGGAPPPPSVPSQEQQLLSLLGLVSANPALAQLLNPQAHAPPQQNPLAALLRGGNFGAALDSGNNNSALNPTLLSLLLSQNSGSNQPGYMSMDSGRSM